MPGFRPVRFPGPPSEPDEHVSAHPALHGITPFSAHGVGILVPRYGSGLPHFPGSARDPDPEGVLATTGATYAPASVNAAARPPGAIIARRRSDGSRHTTPSAGPPSPDLSRCGAEVAGGNEPASNRRPHGVGQHPGQRPGATEGGAGRGRQQRQAAQAEGRVGDQRSHRRRRARKRTIANPTLSTMHPAPSAPAAHGREYAPLPTARLIVACPTCTPRAARKMTTKPIYLHPNCSLTRRGRRGHHHRPRPRRAPPGLGRGAGVAGGARASSSSALQVQRGAARHGDANPD